MPNYYEDFLRPEDYAPSVLAHNIRIVKPPLINTSVGELAEAGWFLHVESRRIVTAGGSKVTLRFRPPDGGPAGLNFKFFAKDVYISSREHISQLLNWLDQLTEPKHLTEKVATVTSEVSYQEIAYTRKDPKTLETAHAVPAAVPLIDMIMDHPDLSVFEAEILERINSKRAETIKLPTLSRVEVSEPALNDLTEYFERIFLEEASPTLEPV